MLTIVAEFYEDDVNTRMPAALSLIEPAIMILIGGFVKFVVIALYLPSLSIKAAAADSWRGPNRDRIKLDADGRA